jgi:hypothetical protein
MASSKSKTGVRSSSGRHGRTAGKPTLKTAFFLSTGASLPKGGPSLKLLVPNKAYQVLASKPARLKAVLQQYGKAVTRSRAAGHTVSFRVDVDPAGATTMTPVEEVKPAQKHLPEESGVPGAELQDALASARERGRLRAADILSSEDMLSAEDFAKLLGTTRVTVNTKRQSGQILGLDGAKRGFRFPTWQLNPDGKPFAELSALHDLLGGPWAVYRFLVQANGELKGLTGRQALEQGKSRAVLAAAESVGRDFR